MVCVLLGLSGRAVRAQGMNGPPPPGMQAMEAPPLFKRTCSLCHGADATGTDRAPTMVNSPQLHGLSDSEIATIIQKGKGKMPAFPLPSANIEQLVRYIRSINTTASGTAVAGDAKAGEAIFFASGSCSTCHVARGRGTPNGPDLSNVANRMRLANMQQALVNPSASMTAGYSVASVELNDGTTLQGLLRAQGSHDLVLQTSDGKLHLLLDSEYRTVTADPHSIMPAFQGTADQQRDLLAYLATLIGVGVGPLKQAQPPVAPTDITAVQHPAKGNWPNYNGTLDGNRNSPLDQINGTNV